MTSEASSNTESGISIQELGDQWSAIFSESPEITDFLCPLSGQPMTDPVRAEDGFNYERKVIEKYFSDLEANREEILSPMLGSAMGMSLSPVGDLREAIHMFTKEYWKRCQVPEAGSPAQSDWSMVEWSSHGLQSTEVRRSLSSNDPSLLAAGQADIYADMNKRMSEVFKVLDPLRDLLHEVLDGWTPPKIVVIGDESSGKSTLLEQLSMMPIFPRQKRFCTRLAIHVRLRRSFEPVNLATLSVVDQAEKKTEVGPYPIPIEHGFGHVQKEMERLISSNASVASAGVLKSKIIVLEVCHPAVPSIDLVDLPGLTTIRKNGQATEVKEIIEMQLDEDKASGDHAMYLVIVPASDRPNCSASMGFIEENNLQSRAFGVFTHCDEPGKVTSDELKSLMLGSTTEDGEAADTLGHVPLDKGWVGTMLAKPKDQGRAQGYYDTHNYERLYRQKKDELEFFSGEHADPILRQLFLEGRMGVCALSDRLVKAYTDCLTSTWKIQAMKKVLRKLEEKEFERNLLGIANSGNVQSLAAKEAQRRIDAHSDEAHACYLGEVRQELTNKVRRELGERSGGKEVLGEELDELRKSIVDKLEEVVDDCLLNDSTGVVSRWSKELKALLSAEFKVEQKNCSTLEVILKSALYSFGQLGHALFPKGNKREVYEAIKQQPLFRLDHYKEYTDALLDEFVTEYKKAADRIKKEVAKLCERLVGFDSKWMSFVPSTTSVRHVAVRCDVQDFLDTFTAMCLSLIPSPAKLVKTIPLQAIPLGEEAQAASQGRAALEDEILKLTTARDGLRRALSVSDEELQEIYKELH